MHRCPEALKSEHLPNERLQYEFALSTLQSAPKSIEPGEEVQWTFFALYKENHRAATGPKDVALVDRVLKAHVKLKPLDELSLQRVNGSTSLFDIAPLLSVRDLRKDEVDTLFGRERRHEEKGLSFFYGRDFYVALHKKELLLQRPHGHIMRSGQHILPNDETLSSTCWAYGVFNSQVTVGNTSFHKVLSLSRNPLNVLRSTGQRVFVKTGNGYELLAVPSALEMGRNHMKWIYRCKSGDTIIVKSWTSLDNPACFLELEAANEEREFLISHSLVLGDRELDQSGRVEINGNHVTLLPQQGGFLAKHYPEARFFIVCADEQAIEKIGGDELLYNDGRHRHGPFVVVKTLPVRRFSLTLTGNVLSEARATKLAEQYARRLDSFEEVQKKSSEFWSGLQKQARLSLGEPSGKQQETVAKISEMLPWYAHNAMVHFTVPHGLEQYSGAAWGLRDVCQGPTEFLTATRNFRALREMLKVVFLQQSPSSGDWPQWFMLDRYRKIRAGDSHGDIIMWPLKALCDYIENTNDFSILNERVAYTDDKSLLTTSHKATIWAHVEKEIAAIRAGCVQGTALYHYGHGDWEDTLQPADPRMRDHMVSTWTVELAYQTLRRFSQICRLSQRKDDAEQIDTFCDRIRAEFNEHLVKDGIVAGLVYFRGKNANLKRADYMLHPRDRKTGVKYRLLPMTRGIISGLFTPEQVKDHLSVIRRHLLFPDGVRLMDRPLPYRGGVEKYFKRAESAANFGREISLQYVHAHIRYIEAMAVWERRRRSMKVFWQLLRSLFIGFFRRPNFAKQRLLQQFGCGFRGSLRGTSPLLSNQEAASSDKWWLACVLEWARDVLPPSGFMFLGLRRHFEDVVFDPVIPQRLSGLEFDFEQDGKNVRYTYHVKEKMFSPNRVVVNGHDLDNARYSENRYRHGGFLINHDILDKMLNQEQIGL
jgi:cellobiose phosphorylase